MVSSKHKFQSKLSLKTSLTPSKYFFSRDLRNDNSCLLHCIMYNCNRSTLCTTLIAKIHRYHVKMLVNVSHWKMTKSNKNWKRMQEKESTLMMVWIEKSVPRDAEQWPSRQIFLSTPNSHDRFLKCIHSVLGIHLPTVLEEQGHAKKNKDGRHKESVPLPLWEQYQKEAQTMCRFQKNRWGRFKLFMLY